MKIHSRQLLVESSLKQLYISSTYYIINNHRCKNKNFGFWCTNEPTQITMDRKMATTFLILAKTFMHTVYIIQCQQWIHRFKTKTLVSLCTQMKQLKQLIFRLITKMVDIKDNSDNRFFVIASTDSCIFSSNEICNPFCLD